LIQVKEKQSAKERIQSQKHWILQESNQDNADFSDHLEK